MRELMLEEFANGWAAICLSRAGELELLRFFGQAYRRAVAEAPNEMKQSTIKAAHAEARETMKTINVTAEKINGTLNWTSSLIFACRSIF